MMIVERARAVFGGKPSRDTDALSFERPESEQDDKQDPVVTNDLIIQNDEKSFDEATRGGLGRHLGFWSTYFLMYEIIPKEWRCWKDRDLTFIPS